MSIIRDFRRSYFNFRENARGIELPGPRLNAPSGKRIGYVERICFTPSCIIVEGWADADRISLMNSDKVKIAEAVTCIDRRDVQAALGSAKASYGFSAKIAAQSEPITLTVHRGREKAVVQLPQLSSINRIRGELTLALRYGHLVRLALPDIIDWLRYRNPQARRRIGATFRSRGPAAIALDIAALDGDPWPELPNVPITIIMPVYQGLHLLDEVIKRVRDHTDLPWHLVIIDDASPDPRVLERLRHWQTMLTADRMTLLVNSINLGFVGTTNVGLKVAIARGFHTVLLNSDALVPAGWASRLLAPIINSVNVASVTPFSNDAEIANVPIPCKPIALAPGEGDALDRRAQYHANIGSVVEAPTGVGFCMAMNIEMLRKIPLLDTAFGRGYGEEVDWCQKAIALGWRNLLTAGLFVEHYGGQSFGPDAKQSLIRKNGLIISRRYPKFDEKVQNFLSTDPLRTQRLMLGIDMAAIRAGSNGRKLVIFLGHGMGGGAETYLRQRVQRELIATGYAVVIRTMPDATWHIELHSEGGELSGRVDNITTAMSFFKSHRAIHVVYSCGVGSTCPNEIPNALSRLAAQPDSTLEVAFNDYFPISPSYTLLDSQNSFSGFPLNSNDPAHRFTKSDGSVINLEEWQNLWGKMIHDASRITTFSLSSAAIIREVWPEKKNLICIEPHRLTAPIPVLNKSSDQPVIGVLGNISLAKGAEVLERISRAMTARRIGKLVLIGNIEPGYRLTKPSLVLGSYQLNDLENIVDRYGITQWFFPSIWPETFSYAVHEMIATGLPVWSFDIGGQADAVRAAQKRGQGGGLISLHHGTFEVDKLVNTLVKNNHIAAEGTIYAY